MTSQSDMLARLPESAWTAFEVTDDYVRSYAIVDINGTAVRAERTQYLADELLQEANKEEYKDSETKRWGDGRIVARVPLNVLFDPVRQLAEKMREGDRDHLPWWLDSEDALPFRNFKGRIR